MRWLRSTWHLRAVAVLLVTSLLPTAVVWPEQAATHAPSNTHADWVRAQVRTAVEGTDRTAFEAALDTASESAAHSLQDFLRHFAAAYAQQDADLSLAELFGVTEGTHERVIDALQRRLAQVSRWAVVLRFSTAWHAGSFSSPRPLATAATLNAPDLFVVSRGDAVPHVHRALGRSLRHVLSALRPRAP